MFIGIDIGTQGARVILMNENGDQLGSREEAFPLSAASREEQSPEGWWEACRKCLSSLLLSVGRSDVRSIAVTSTSGTIIPLDRGHVPLHAALMYSDKRSVAEGKLCTSE